MVTTFDGIVVGLKLVTSSASGAVVLVVLLLG